MASQSGGRAGWGPGGGSIEFDGGAAAHTARRHNGHRRYGRHVPIDQHHTRTVVTREVVVPLIFFSVTRGALGTTVEVEVLAAHAGQIEDGLSLLDELDRRWGTEDELAALADQPVGSSVEVSWDTALLLTMFPVPGLLIDLGIATVTAAGPLGLPSWAERRMLATEFVLRELLDGGCAAAAVAMGGVCRVEHGGMAVPFRHQRNCAAGGLAG